MATPPRDARTLFGAPMEWLSPPTSPKTISPTTTCSICLEEYGKDIGHRPVCIPCGHIFGERCIREWLERPGILRCPTCGKPATKDRIRVLFGDVPVVTSTQSEPAPVDAVATLRNALARVDSCTKACDDEIERLVIPKRIRDYLARDTKERQQVFLNFAKDIENLDNEFKRTIVTFEAYKGVLKRCRDARATAASQKSTEGSPLLNEATLELMARERELSDARRRLDMAIRFFSDYATRVRYIEAYTALRFTDYKSLLDWFDQSFHKIRDEHANLGTARKFVETAQEKLAELNLK